MTERNQHDFELVRQARDLNDQKAYAALLNNYWDNTHLLLLRITHNEAVAEDLTMVAFSKAFASLGTFSPKNTFGTWLFRIATNAGIDYLRRNRDGQTYLEDMAIPVDDSHIVEFPISSPDDDPEQAIIRQQRLKLLQKAMNQIDPDYKDLVELRYFEDLSVEDIAKMLKMPESTVRVRLHRAKNYLRTLISTMDCYDDLKD